MGQPGSDHLTSFQLEFIEKFLGPGSAPYHQLIAPVGFGKTAVAATIAQRMAAHGEACRILVLVPAVAVGEHYASSLREDMADIPVGMIDRRSFRELVDRVPVGVSPWPSRIIAVMTLDLGRRPDIAESLCKVGWDLVLIDEAHRLAGKRGEVIHYLLRARAVKRLLLITGTPPEKGYDFSIQDLETTKWTYDLVFGGLRRPALRITLVRYRRTPEEVSFLGRLGELTGHLADTPSADLMRWLFVRAASSSLYAAEQMLRGVRNRLAHGVSSFTPRDSESPSMSDLGDVLSSMSGEALAQWKDPGAALQAITHAIDNLDLIPEDAKSEALVSLLSEIDRDDASRHVCIFTSLARTVSYLQAVIGDTTSHLHRLTGELSHSEREAEADRFNSEGGILLATFAGAYDSRLSSQSAILYELPESPGVMAQLFEGFQPLAGGREPDVYVLRDLSGAIPEEEDLLRLHGLAD